MKSVRTVDLRPWRLSGFIRATLAMWIAKKLQQTCAQDLDLAAQLVVLQSVGARLRAHNDIGRRPRVVTTQQLQNPEAPQLSQATLESVALDRRVAVLRNHETDSGHCAGRKNDPQIEVVGAETLSVPHRCAQIAAARQPLTPP